MVSKSRGAIWVYRANKDIVDPDTHKFLGQEVVFSGVVSTLPYTDSALDARQRERCGLFARGRILHPRASFAESADTNRAADGGGRAVSEIRKGDFLLKMTDEGNSFRMMPHAPNRHIDAKVVSIFDGIGEAGQFQTITLNRGEAAGFEKGTVLSL